ncbi:DUF2203 family protein [Xylanibacillus composti]|uniref:DUF2203 family protein n=1 Tax=Xylanibacillus composti TaxID=1572762 RepID=A0A8J4H4N8_9BACL|nr:DUF2203 domain-containing protein [Xylanibacillus composti]MDT9724667.1 DUF2203 family protein [Xylanibacillus composti]GIQ70952.1 hypothetical protein XYCOK13_37760 [Xylanibacillus composti]
MKEKRYFTLEEANKLLPAVQVELTALQAVQARYAELYRSHAKLRRDNAPDEVLFGMESEMDFLQLQAKLNIDNITRTGAELKDIETGLIDFPAKKDGEDILLCWKQGEKEISHYHGLNDGFRGRRPIG